MSQLVFIHGPGAGACADAYTYQLEHFAGSVAPTLPGHLEGTRCPDVARYTEWVRGDWIKNASGKQFTPNNDALVDAIRGWRSKQNTMETQFYNNRISAR